MKEGGEGYGREGRKGKGQGRDGGGRGGMEGGGEGRGGALDMGSAPPPRDKLWIRPLMGSSRCPNIYYNSEGRKR